MLPLCPLRVMVPELDPEQTVALELVDPATVLQLTQSATKPQKVKQGLVVSVRFEAIVKFATVEE